MNDSQDWGKIIGAGMMGLFTVVMAVVFMGAIASAAPQAQYVDPIDGTTWSTYQDLLNHFESAHPGTPITVIWS